VAGALREALMSPTNIDLLKRAPWPRDKVQQIATPPVARRLSTLAHIDYEDAYRIRTGAADQRTGEEWARVIFEDAPFTARGSLLVGWSSLGLRLNPARSDGHVLGWKILASAPDFVLLGADSPLGLRAQLLCERERHAVLFCTLVEKRNAVGRTIWARVEPVHRRVVPRVLRQASIP
jgi:Protein of unknown function (DUF2867)